MTPGGDAGGNTRTTDTTVTVDCGRSQSDGDVTTARAPARCDHLRRTGRGQRAGGATTAAGAIRLTPPPGDNTEGLTRLLTTFRAMLARLGMVDQRGVSTT